MKHFTFSPASRKALEGVNPDLIAVVRLALAKSKVDFSVIDGVRTREEQALYVEEGLSWTMNSKHLTGDAVDLYPWVRGETNHGYEYYLALRMAMLDAAEELGVKVEWGGDWEKHIDKPHWAIVHQPRDYT